MLHQSSLADASACMVQRYDRQGGSFEEACRAQHLVPVGSAELRQGAALFGFLHMCPLSCY